jgi:hypothetical protein
MGKSGLDATPPIVGGSQIIGHHAIDYNATASALCAGLDPLAGAMVGADEPLLIRPALPDQTSQAILWNTA